MHRRRQFLVAVGSAVATGGVVGLSASSSVASSTNADFRIVAPQLITLTPTNDPPIHVRTNDDGYVTAITPGGGERGVNGHAITRFEDIVDITNATTADLTGIYFEFEATSDTLDDGTLADIEAALVVTAGSEPLATTGESGDDLLAASDDPTVADGVLGPGESVPFGVQVNLIPETAPGTISSLPSGEYDVRLRVITERDG
ncbi:hypothetical protein [Halobaculum roseum]|uniref:Uncharacterized protein n=1 Tax=Halobaculum roseum TaxID=2175149 RepID=A0ABD5MNH5_9EURY|nr:hypothetical protein [Halobaculum roseum]QZY03125.1 hypothetical protein K6T36_02745 [Halobaculum roseum]